MKLLVFGQSGQVAQELLRACPPDWEMRALPRAEADLTEPEACAALIRASAADAVINAAAYTAVDRAEEEETLATRINGETPGAMARAAAQRGVPFLHISTDYVFDGSGDRPWRVEDTANPLNAYGRSKLAGEEAVRNAGGAHAILRTSWVFSAHGSNFVKTMLRLGRERDSLSIVVDQIGGPTPATTIAQALVAMVPRLVAEPALSGTYHFSGAPDVSWADFGREIFSQASLSCLVQETSTAGYPTPAVRPLNSRLDCSELERAFDIKRPCWRNGIQRFLQELKIT